MFLQVRAALFHFNQHDGLPDVIGESGATAIFLVFADAEFRRAAHIETTGLAESLEEAVEEDLRLAFFVARDVRLTPRVEFRKFFPARHGAEFARENLWRQCRGG